MERLNLALITKKIYDSKIEIFTIKTLEDILGFPNKSSFFSWLKRLLENRVLVKLEKGKYVLAEAQINTFKLANFIYSSSYVSLESALNFYGVLSQFPVEQTSITVKKSKQKRFQGMLFNYSHIKKDLFWGYQKENDYLIALPEKALLDQLYLVSKGLRKINLDELDFSRLKKRVFLGFAKHYKFDSKLSDQVKKYWERTEYD